MGEQIGRYEIKHELGRGAQSVVYLARDPKLDRDVAVKTLHLEQQEGQSSAALLAEARIVSQLRHPGIVPIFDVGEIGGDPYLVFEYVPGENLQTLIRRRGPLPGDEAARLMVQILEAVQAAHEAGIIHRDLKPTNILMDARGVPRVMDFGIAVKADVANGKADLSGTPAYMAPEYISSGEVGPHTDVFAAGLILLELLTGRPVFRGDSAQAVMRRIAAESVTLPEEPAIDEALGSIALSATQFNTETRYARPADFLLALQNWLAPPDTQDEKPAATGKGTLDFLLRRMQQKSDFPALSESVSAINRIAANENENIDKLSTFILRDFSLTNKLLRIVNSSHYRSVGGGSISTVSRAVVVLGFNAVRNIAITVMLFEHLQNKTNAGHLKEEFLFSNFAGSLARDLSRKIGRRDHEQAYICALFFNLGRLLARFYFQEECDDVATQMRSSGCSEEAAAMRVFGMTYEQVGIEIARRWGFPSIIVDSMRRLSPGPVRKADTAADRAQLLSVFANEVAHAATLPGSDRSLAMARINERFDRSIPLPREAVDEALDTALADLTEFARVIRVNLDQTTIGRNLKGNHPDEADATRTTTTLGGGTDAEGVNTMGGTVLSSGVAPSLDTGSFSEDGVRTQDAQAVLAAGIQDISNTMVDDFKLNDILRIILETMYRGMGFKRVILCIKDARNKTMQGRFGFGPDANEFARRFVFGLEFKADIFHAAIKNGVDVLISDVTDPKIANRMPDWFKTATTAQTFVIFPLNIKEKPVAMIYAEKEQANSITMSDKELSLLRTLRNQAILAIKQSM